jgi:hypothetical protein
VNALEALRQVQPDKGFPVRGKALLREHGRTIGVIYDHCIAGSRCLGSAIPHPGNLM